MKSQYNILGSIVLMVLLSTSVFAQNEELFKYYSESEIKLTERQQKLFESIKARPQSQEVYLIKFTQSDFKMDWEYFHINLPEKTIKAEKRNNVQREVRANTWKGELEDTPISSVQFSSYGQDITGHINAEDARCIVRPLTGGMQVLVKIDPAGFDLEAPGVMLPDSINIDENREKSQQPLQKILSSDPVIQILVAYTSSVNEYSGNVRATIHQAADWLSDSFGIAIFLLVLTL